MRDPARIARIQNLLTEYWMQNPDWRLGQLVYNVIRMYKFGEGDHRSLPPCPDVFYFEDDKIEVALQRLLDSD